MTMSPAWKAMAISLFFISGCASNQVEEKLPEPVLTGEMLDKIRSTKVVIGVDLSSQSQTTHAVVGYSGRQFGLIGAIVDVSINSAMESNRQAHERLMVAIQDAAINFNFGGRFKSEFEPVVRRVGWLRVASLAREPSPQRGKIDALLAEAKEDALLVTDIGYTIAPDLSGFSVSAHTALRLRDDPSVTATGAAAPRRLFRRSYAFHYPLEQSGTDKQQAAKAWAENDGAMVQRALQAGIADMVRKISADLGTLREMAALPQTTTRAEMDSVKF